MRIPDLLKDLIEEHTSKLTLKKLSTSSQNLTQRYRDNQKKQGRCFSQDEDYLAYLTTRFPATYGAIFHVLKRVKARMEQIDTLLDVGAGPGTGLWAAQEIFELKAATLVEREKELISLGISLSNHLNKIKCNWLEKDLTIPFAFETHDLVLVSYVLNELSENVRKQVLESLWKATGKVLIIIEPGTPVGFKHILSAREYLIAQGGHLIAPCPHQNKCPLSESDWCHFAQRIERSSLHRKSKDAELNYEDEKFSYVIFSKEPFSISGERVIRRPQKHSGFVELSLCSSNGVENKIISRKHDNYHEARKLEWGSLSNLNTIPVE